MSVICPACQYDENPDGAEFCEACGEALPPVSSPVNTHQSPDDNSQEKVEVVPENFPVDTTSSSTEKIPLNNELNNSIPSTVKLIAAQSNAPISEFLLTRNNLTIGKFDPDAGPVDINLEKFPDSDNISRKHAEIYLERGQWTIKDLGSTNGVFIRRSNQRDFSARITRPEILNSGDEVAIAQTFFRFQSS